MKRYLALALPFAALLLPFYLRSEPSLGGFPFFYWYQFAWLVASALITWLVYRATRDSAP
jgi:hypothetical protein